MNPEEIQEVLAPELTHPIPARSGTRVVTAEWLTQLTENHYFNTVRWLDNENLIYTAFSGSAGQTAKIETVHVHTGVRTVLNEGEAPEPSPDGQWIAFIRKADDNTKQLYLMKRNGKEIRQLTRLPSGLTGYPQFSFGVAWSPDSRRLALHHQVWVPRWERKTDSVIDDSMTSAIEEGKTHHLVSPPPSIIDIIDVENSESRQVFSAEANIRDLSWFPNGEELLFMMERPENDYKLKAEDERTWIKAVHIHDGRERILVAFKEMQQSLRPVVSPDGQQVAFMHDADNPIFNYMLSVGLVSVKKEDGKKLPPIQRLTYEMKLSFPQWSPESDRLYVIRYYGAYQQIYAIDVSSKKVTQLTHLALAIDSYSLSPEGTQLAWRGINPHGKSVIGITAIQGDKTHELVSFHTAPDDMALSEIREVDWKVSDYPARMRGLLLLPLNYKKGTRYPLIVDIHGGGSGSRLYMMGGILVSTPLEWQWWAAKEYAVFVPEFRSSAAFGSLAITRDDLQNHNIVDCDIRDIIAGVKTLIADGIVDSKRMIAFGHSAGGRRVNWLITQKNNPFCAVISKEGWADEWFQMSVRPLKRVEKMFGGHPSIVPHNYQKNSSIFHTEYLSIPALFLMGNPDKGGADARDTVKILYQALLARGIETSYVCYPDEGHVFQRPPNLLDALERAAQWVAKHFELALKMQA